ncbi:hypothetical protein BRC91_12755 [Halobacteriales archaeon QS_4_62_28]|nr:MAG: hypothetical protein BRC91_12755 [Halobacteriales archaeon QS_4_62_28]
MCVSTLVEDVVVPLADQHPGASINTTIEVDEMRSDRQWLALILSEVVENALVHTGHDPTVDITITRTGEAVEIGVTDDGPGIPQIEIDPIMAGRETDLQHASSLGLWVVSWITRALGGTIDIAVTGAGSTVTMTVPDLSDESAVEPPPLATATEHVDHDL